MRNKAESIYLAGWGTVEEEKLEELWKALEYQPAEFEERERKDGIVWVFRK